MFNVPSGLVRENSSALGSHFMAETEGDFGVAKQSGVQMMISIANYDEVFKCYSTVHNMK